MSESINKIKQIKAIKNGRGIQYILDEVYKIFENPILIHDMDYKLIAYPSGAINDDRIWNEFMTYGRLSDETIEFCKNENFIDSVANSTNFDGITYLISDKLKYNRIFGQLYNKNNMPVADLCAVACEKPFEDDIPELIKFICNILSKELGESDYFQDYGQTYQESIMKKLIEGSIEDKAIYTGHVANIDKDLKDNIFVAVADISKCNQERTNLVYFRDLFKRTKPSFKYFIYTDYIVILLSSDHSTLKVKKDMSRLNRLFEQENIYAGVSSCFDNLYELQKYYLEAIKALNCRPQNDITRRIFSYNELMQVFNETI